MKYYPMEQGEGGLAREFGGIGFVIKYSGHTFSNEKFTREVHNNLFKNGANYFLSFF